MGGAGSLGLLSAGLVPFCVTAKSGGAVVVPLGLFDADDVGRCRACSAVECIEFPLALADDGRAATAGGIGELRPTFLGSARDGWTGEDAMLGDNAAAAVLLFLEALVEVGKAFRFFAGSEAGAGVARGLEVLALVVLLPNTELIARSIGCPPLGALLLSTFRLFEGGFPLTGAPPVMPKPTGAAASAPFRDLLLPPCALFAVSAFCLLS